MNNTLMKIASVAAMVVAVALVAAVMARHSSILLIADTFLLFMAAFCFLQSQFLAARKAAAKRLLGLIALVFVVLAMIFLIAVMALARLSLIDGL